VIIGFAARGCSGEDVECLGEDLVLSIPLKEG